MHREAKQWVVAQTAGRRWNRVLELGSRDVNGSVRRLVRANYYHGVDVAPGKGVDEVADAAEYVAGALFDLVLCCEVLEHAPKWAAIVARAAEALKPGGCAIFTMAALGRKPHSAVDEQPIRDWEYYANIDPSELVQVVEQYFVQYTISRTMTPSDVRFVAQR